VQPEKSGFKVMIDMIFSVLAETRPSVHSGGHSDTRTKGPIPAG
jgi:hypothetical protein